MNRRISVPAAFAAAYQAGYPVSAWSDEAREAVLRGAEHLPVLYSERFQWAERILTAIEPFVQKRIAEVVQSRDAPAGTCAITGCGRPATHRHWLGYSPTDDYCDSHRCGTCTSIPKGR